MRHILALAFFVLLLVANGEAFAEESVHVGFRTLGQYDQENGLRLDVNVWYPTARAERDISIGPWEFSAAREAKPLEGRYPLLLFSHDTAGTRFSYHDTASALATMGFVVAAPNHPTDNMDNMDDLLTWNQLEGRVRELKGTIELLLSTPVVESSIDRQRIGVVGFGAGGTAALLLGGALPDCTNWHGYCAEADPADVYCHVWAKKRLDELCQKFPLTRSLADTRIKSVAAIGPSFGMLFSKASFRWFYPPLLLMATEGDRENPRERHAQRLFELLDKKPRYARLPGADVGALMSACPPLLAWQLPELCRSVSSTKRTMIHKFLHGALSDFFLHYLGEPDRVPLIPQPPDLTPPTPKPPPPAPQTRSNRRR
ncbi:MAG: dienelactone hydrolase family protein [Desulfovibrio sp.]|nr:dienelactone hydrolase family protein [Desulfovibrio sp.]